MDFVSDRLVDGRPFRIRTVVDGHTRKTLSLDGSEMFKLEGVKDGLKPGGKVTALIKRANGK